MSYGAIYDAALVLKDPGTTLTSTGYGTATEFPLIPTSPWNAEHQDWVKVIFDVTAITLSGGTFVLKIQADNASSFSAGVVDLAYQAITAVGRYALCFSKHTAALLLSDATHIRCGVVIGGSGSPSITYGCFLTK